MRNLSRPRSLPPLFRPLCSPKSQPKFLKSHHLLDFRCPAAGVSQRSHIHAASFPIRPAQIYGLDIAGGQSAPGTTLDFIKSQECLRPLVVPDELLTWIERPNHHDVSPHPDHVPVNLEAFRLILLEASKSEKPMIYWARMLEYGRHIWGDDGLRAIFDIVVEQDMQLAYEGHVAEYFWRRLLEMSTAHPLTLERVYQYAQRRLQDHGDSWPYFYYDTVTSLLAGEHFEAALTWHQTLLRGFDPGPQVLSRIIWIFESNRADVMHSTLQDMYQTSPHRQQYDEVVSYLFYQGKSQAARRWRQKFVDNGDVPIYLTSSPCRQFIRFVKLVDHEVKLTEEELLAASVAAPAPQSEETKMPRLLSAVKDARRTLDGATVNDEFSAKWFATTWIPLNIIISMQRASGICAIGPLSLKSIAERDKTPSAILYRIGQLQLNNISTGESTYSKAVIHFAQTGNSSAITELLSCDIHPQAFDDTKLMQAILEESTKRGDLTTYRLILSMQLVFIRHNGAAMLNSALQVLLERPTPNIQHIHKTLIDMRAKSVPPSATNSERLFRVLLESFEIPEDLKAREPSFQLEAILKASEVLKLLAGMWIPVPAVLWLSILQHLGRKQRLLELAGTCKDIVGIYRTYWRRGGLLPVHPKDFIPLAVFPDRLPPYVLASDLNFMEPIHPLNRILQPDIQKSIVHWGFVYALRHPQSRFSALGRREKPLDFDVAQGIKILRDLRSYGLMVHQVAIQRWILGLFAKIHGPIGLRRHPSRSSESLQYAKVKAICEDAWGCPFLPDFIEASETEPGPANVRRPRLRGLSRKRLPKDALGVGEARTGDSQEAMAS